MTALVAVLALYAAMLAVVVVGLVVVATATVVTRLVCGVFGRRACCVAPDLTPVLPLARARLRRPWAGFRAQHLGAAAAPRKESRPS